MPDKNEQEKYSADEFVAPLPGADPRLRLIYQLLKFEVKLFLDGASDLLLSALAIGAVILGLVRGGADADRPLRQVMSLGRRAEHWINLYGGNHSEASADALVAPLERQLAKRLERSGVVDHAERALGALDKMIRTGSGETAATRTSVPAPPSPAVSTAESVASPPTPRTPHAAPPTASSRQGISTNTTSTNATLTNTASDESRVVPPAPPAPPTGQPTSRD